MNGRHVNQMGRPHRQETAISLAVTIISVFVIVIGVILIVSLLLSPDRTVIPFTFHGLVKGSKQACFVELNNEDRSERCYEWGRRWLK